MQAESVRVSPNPHQDAVLLAYETALILGDAAEAARFLKTCTGLDGIGGIPGCSESKRLHDLFI